VAAKQASRDLAQLTKRWKQGGTDDFVMVATLNGVSLASLDPFAPPEISKKR
jgi:hypothetical protein